MSLCSSVLESLHPVPSWASYLPVAWTRACPSPVSVFPNTLPRAQDSLCGQLRGEGGHGHLSKDGSQSLQTSTLHLPSWVKVMVHGDQDACISQWLFLQTVVQEVPEEGFVVKDKPPQNSPPPWRLVLTPTIRSVCTHMKNCSRGTGKCPQGRGGAGLRGHRRRWKDV